MRVAAAEEPPGQPAPTPRAATFWHNSIGVKAAMSVTGLVLALFLVEHVVGNLLIYGGAGVIDGFARALDARALVWLVWLVRVVLAVAFLVHAVSGVALYLEKRRARPVPYARRRDVQATLPSRLMIWTGLVILVFVVLHLLHMAIGVLHPDFHALDHPYENVVTAFRHVAVSVGYVVAMLALGLHLWHGLYSMFTSVGLRRPRFTPGVRSGAALVATILALGFASIPVAVLVGLGR